MRAIAVLQKLLRRSIPSIHAKRLTVLTAVIGSALQGGRLTLSALGRALCGESSVRHRIKRVDRLLGNEHLIEERLLFYRLLCDLLIGGRSEPEVIVDWSDLKPDRSLQLLRASVRVHGYALPIYEEVHPCSRQHSPTVHREFLLTLRMLLPEGCRPIMIADAGFRSTWFVQVERIGWHWVGRIRGRTLVETALGEWTRCTVVGANATAVPIAMGARRVVRARPVSCELYLYRKAAQGRSRTNLDGARARRAQSQTCADREREPWLLAASHSLADRSALDIVNLYRVRARIEQTFRTLKSHQFGFGFEDSQSRSSERIAVLLLIHALALLLAWIAGWAAERSGLRARLQSNADRGVSLSIITLRWMALTMIRLRLCTRDFTSALHYPPPLSRADDRERI